MKFKKIIYLILMALFIFSCSKNEKINYNGIWLTTNTKGELENNHFVIIENIEDRAIIIDIQIINKEIIKNSFYASYSDNKIVWPGSPLSLQFEYIKGSQIIDKPASFKNDDELLKVTQRLIIPEAGQNSTYTGYYKKLKKDSIDFFRNILKN